MSLSLNRSMIMNNKIGSLPEQLNPEAEDLFTVVGSGDDGETEVGGDGHRARRANGDAHAGAWQRGGRFWFRHVDRRRAVFGRDGGRSEQQRKHERSHSAPFQGVWG